MKQVLRYGLTTPMRPFELPELWNGEETFVVDTNTKAEHTEQAGTHVIIVPQGSKGKISIKREISGNCQSKLAIDIEEDSEVQIEEEISGSGTLAASTIVRTEKNCNVQYHILQNMSEDSVAILDYKALTSKSVMDWLFFGVGGETTQARIETLAGEEVQTKNNAVICGNKKQQFDIHVSTKHLGPNSRSDMLTRSVLADEARAIYHGLITITPEAWEVDSYQKDEVILVSDKAAADAIPNLEIQNNRVRCSHGASIGKVDEEKLFYFRSRGIESHEAKRMITQGFLEPLLTENWKLLLEEKLK